MEKKVCKRKFCQAISSFLKNPKTSFVIGMMLFVGAAFEVSETLIEQVVENFLHFEIGVEHGIFIFALSHVLVAICDMLEGVEDMEVGELEQAVKG